MIWWHFTCNHGHAGIVKTGRLLPTTSLVDASAVARMAATQRRVAELVWLTDLADPVRDALGLTSHEIACDRTQHRWRAVNYRPIRYTTIRRDLPQPVRAGLESAPGVLPMHWWVAYTPVPVVYDPIVATGVGR